MDAGIYKFGFWLRFISTDVSIAKPDEQSVRKFVAEQADKPLSYNEVGATLNENAPAGYTIDHNRIKLGTGYSTFERAIEAVRNWKMFDIPWIKLCFEDTPIKVGQTVAIMANHFGFWSLNAAQIVYVLDETENAVEKFGFAYGTLDEHAERGEERFSVEYHAADETVWYDLYAFSQTNQFLAQIGYPVSRYLQKEFARESKAAMQKVVAK